MVSMFLFRNLDIEGQYSRNNGFEVEGQHSNNDGADSAERRMPRTILDPRGQFLQVYNKILLVSCVVAVSVDPLFFYIPIINDDLNEKVPCVRQKVDDHSFCFADGH
jgi:hypothetical protein